MLLSQILALADSERAAFYGSVTVDVESYSPPVGIKAIGLRCDAADGEISDRLMDTVISYRLANVDVVLEIPAETTDVDAGYLLSVASNAGFSLALLPPETDTDAIWASYGTRMDAFLDAYLGQRNFAHYLYPISSFLEYLFAAQVSDVTGYSATDPYVVETFAQRVSAVREDALKARLRERIMQAFDGEEGFRQFAQAILRGVYKDVETILRERAAQPAAAGV